MDKARISVVSAGQDEEVIMHPTDHPKVGELEHFVHDPHHLHIKTVFAACGQSRVMVGLKIMRMTMAICMRITKRMMTLKHVKLTLSTLLQKPTLEEKMVIRSGTSAVDWKKGKTLQKCMFEILSQR